ncbi:MAG: T9SS type A sorting domain-containing protein [Bacteroidia bacterium]
MKLLLTLTSILLLAQPAIAQSAARATTGSGGGTALVGGFHYSYTAGEAVTGSQTAPTVILTLGVQQPEQSGSLPVELLDFTVSLFNQTARLRWTTSVEIQSDYFVMERSIDGLSYEQIGRLPAAGYADEPSFYAFDDEQAGFLGQKVLFYRLRQFDLDGGFSLSPVVQLNLTELAQAQSVLFPNPASTEAFLRYQLPSGPATWSLSTVDGKIIQNGILEASSGLLKIPVHTLAEGSYLVTLSAAGGLHAHKLIISH